jgi:hypothetical protein
VLKSEIMQGGNGIQGVAQRWGAVSPCPSTNTINTKPAVTRNAPIQSTLLSFSVDGGSLSKNASPPRKQSVVRPHSKKKGDRQVSLLIEEIRG